jgi:hypothetical protein
MNADITNRFGYWMDNRGTVHQFPAGNIIASLIQNVKIGPGTKLSSYSVDTEDLFPGGKTTGMWDWPLTLSSAKIKIECSYTPTPPTK